GDVENQVRGHSLGVMNQALFQSVQIFGVSRAVLEPYVFVRWRFRHWIIVFLMDGKCKNSRVVRKNCRGAVAMMHIGVHDHRRLDGSCGLERPNRNRHVMDHAEAFPMSGIRVMESTAEICGESILKSPAS